jgi:multidrug efflux pump subunit AcrA (membrane-fusion protein)
MIRHLSQAALLCLLSANLVGAQDFPAIDDPLDPFANPAGEVAINEDGSLKGSVVYIDELDLAVSESGVLSQAPEEGDIVELDEVVARTDETDAKARRLVAFYAWKAAEKELESDIRMQYAKKNAEVAKASYDDAVAANRRQKKAISEFEIRRRKFEWESGMLNIENTQHEMSVSKVAVLQQKAEYDAATLMLRHHEVRAPISGMVEKKYLGKGSFVRPGDPICHIVRLDRMRVQVEVPIGKYSPSELKNREVTIKIEVGAEDGKPIYENFDAKIDFVSSSIEISDSIRVWTEFENRGDFIVRKGMNARVYMN